MGGPGGSAELASWAERRCAMRVPVRGTAVLHADGGRLHGTLDNLSQTGALVTVTGEPDDTELELELRLLDRSGMVGVHAVRVEPGTRPGAGWQIAVAFDRIEPVMRAAIESAIAAAVSAARRRPVLVIDDQAERRGELIDRLVDQGMTPIAPRTPLEAIDLLTRAHLQISLCLLAPHAELAEILADSFPWVTISDISDELASTVERAVEAWSTTRIARLGVAIG